MLDFIRIACAVPAVKVGDVKKNAEDICAYMEQADSENVDLLLFPELAVTGYSCADLFLQDALLDVASRFYAVVDYPDEDIEDIHPDQIATEFDRFRLRRFSRMGIRTQVSRWARSRSSGSPAVSRPKRMWSPSAYSTSA